MFCVALSLTSCVTKRPTAVGDEEIGIFVQIDERERALLIRYQNARVVSLFSLILMLILNIDPRTEYFARYELHAPGNAHGVHRHRGPLEGRTGGDEPRGGGGRGASEKTVTETGDFLLLRAPSIKYYVNSREISSFSRSRIYYIYPAESRNGKGDSEAFVRTRISETHHRGATRGSNETCCVEWERVCYYSGLRD